MPVVTRFVSYASHPYLPLTARLTSNFKKKRPILPGLVSTGANDHCRHWELWHHPENIDIIMRASCGETDTIYALWKVQLQCHLSS